MEQALVFASIILGVAVALELENLHHLLRADNVRWHWAQPIFALLVLFVIMFFWWSLARDTEGEIALGEFVPIMWSLVMLVLLSAVALPGKIGESGVDLAEYYQTNRRYMWLLLVLAALPMELQYIYNSAQRSDTIAEFAARAGGDIIAWTVIATMIFLRRWSFIAIGFAILSLGPLAWLSRTI